MLQNTPWEESKNTAGLRIVAGKNNKGYIYQRINNKIKYKKKSICFFF